MLKREIAALRGQSSVLDPEFIESVAAGDSTPSWEFDGRERWNRFRAVRIGSTYIGSRWVGPFSGSTSRWDYGAKTPDPELIPAWPHHLAIPRDDPEHLLQVAFAIETGWPARALGGEVAFFLKHPARVESHSAVLLASDPEADPRTWPFRVIPLRILWAGFAANTACWAALFLAARYTPTFVRMLRRGPPGSCRQCGYCLLGQDRCPECGSPNQLPSPRPA